MLKDKLREARGAAMVIALMFFLFCTLVGTIVVTAAAANAGKAAKMREEQQEYLAVRSAAQLVADMMSTGSVQGYFTVDDLLVETQTEVGGILQTVVTHQISFISAPDPADPENKKRTGYTVQGIQCLEEGLRTAIGNLYLSGCSYSGVALLSRLDGFDVSGQDQYKVPDVIQSTFVVAVGGLPPAKVTLEVSKGGDGTLPIYSASLTASSTTGNYKVVLEGIATVRTNTTTSFPAANLTRTRSTTDISWENWEAKKEVVPG